MRYSFQPKDGADQYGESLSLALSDSSNPDAVNNVFISNSASYVPRKIDGRIYFSTGFLIGKVIDYQTGNPISGASATASPGEYAASTRSDGTFTIGGTDGVPPGAYSVSIQKNGYYPARVLGSVAGKGSTTDLGAAALFQVPPSQGGFQRGRLNGDSAMDISDGIVLLSYLFQGSGSLSCLEAADSNDDGTLDLSDAISIFGYLFTSGNPLPAPFFSCGPDPTPDSLGCQSFPGC
jgi:hypothetical protein